MALFAANSDFPCFFFNYYYYRHYRYICMEEKRITQKQLKEVHAQNTNTETNEEEKGN